MQANANTSIVADRAIRRSQTKMYARCQHISFVQNMQCGYAQMSPVCRVEGSREMPSRHKLGFGEDLSVDDGCSPKLVT